MKRFQDTSWVRPLPWPEGFRVDLAIALSLAVASPITGLLYMRMGVYGESAEYAAPWLWAVGIGLTALPLAFRRRYPIGVAVLVSIGFFVCGQFGVPDALMIQICMFLALYSIGAWGQQRIHALFARLGITLAMFIWVILTLIIASSDQSLFPGAPRTGIFSAFATFATIQIITNLLYFGAAFLFGERSWLAARTQALLEAQGQELELERQTSAAQAVALDRVAIARELHDVVAHHVSVMGIQAAAARRLLDRDADRARESLEIVEASAHSAIDELRSLVHTLRTPENDEAATTVGTAHIPALITESHRAGVPATLIIVGDPRPLPMLIDVALYRVVQEALTNVRKHAGRGAQSEIRLRFTPSAVEVEITDDGHQRRHSSSAEKGSRLGLRGMRERIGAVGGNVSAEPREDTGFIVRASVPLSSTGASASPDSEPLTSTATPMHTPPKDQEII